LGHGVFVNCETVRHRDFTINLAAVEMQLLGHAGKITREQIRDFAAGQALQWATELENGTIKKSGLPRQIARSVAGYLTNHLNQQDAVKGRGGWFGRDSRTAGASGMSEAERAARLRMIENT